MILDLGFFACVVLKFMFMEALGELPSKVMFPIDLPLETKCCGFDLNLKFMHQQHMLNNHKPRGFCWQNKRIVANLKVGLPQFGLFILFIAKELVFLSLVEVFF